MSRKTPSNSAHGFGDIIGVALLFAALLLLVAQWTFDRDDISFLTTRLNKPTHNLIGPLGAYLAWASFIPFGLVGYLLPFLLAVFGLAYLLNFPSYLRERLRWSLVWSAILVISLTGLLCIMSNAGWFRKISENIGSLIGAGGFLGFLTFGQTPRYEYGFSLLGTAGAIIVYLALGLISLLFLTNFRLGDWIRGFLEKVPASTTDTEPAPKSADEGALERRARELEKQAKQVAGGSRPLRARRGYAARARTDRARFERAASQSGPPRHRIRKTTLPEPVKPGTAPPREGRRNSCSAPKSAPPPTEEILGEKLRAERPAEAENRRPVRRNQKCRTGKS